MKYDSSAIREDETPRAVVPLLQHAIDTYASEINKVYATWVQFSEAELEEFATGEENRSIIESRLFRVVSPRQVKRTE